MTKTDRLFIKLRETIGEAYVIQDPDRLKVFAIDGKKPKVVVTPGTIDEVSRVVAYANQQHLAIIPGMEAK
jgi:FAD/FMN-containing dehydrogenase